MSRIFLVTASLFYILIQLSCNHVVSIQVVKRQAPGGNGPLPRIPSEELLPPPALSSSFPTLRPPTRNSFNGQPPPFQSVPVRPTGSHLSRPNPEGSPPVPLNGNSEEYPLLPPIEIPPEKPLLDSEITHVPPAPTSFVPTTGQAANHHFTLGPPNPTVPPQNTHLNHNVATTLRNTDQNPTINPPSNVRFPEANESTQPQRNCPVCECTSETDYICGSNGVLYLNSCSFDCATFCDAGLTKVELDFCSSQNQ